MPRECPRRTIYPNNTMYFSVDLTAEKVKASLEYDLMALDIQDAQSPVLEEGEEKTRRDYETTLARQRVEDEHITRLNVTREEKDVISFRLLRASLLQRMVLVYPSIYSLEDKVEQALREHYGLSKEKARDSSGRPDPLDFLAVVDSAAVYIRTEYHEDGKPEGINHWVCHFQDDGVPGSVIRFEKPCKITPRDDLKHKAVVRAATQRKQDLENAISGVMIGAFWFHQTMALETTADIRIAGEVKPFERIFTDSFRYGTEVYEELLFSHWSQEEIGILYRECARKWNEYFRGPVEAEVKREADFLPRQKASGRSSAT